MASDAVEYVAVPALTVPCPSVALPSLKVTVPVGIPPVCPVTVAVKVTDAPKAEGFADALSAVVVVAC